MRTDLNKQLCERERIGSRRGFKEVRRKKIFTRLGEEGENLSAREGMKRRYILSSYDTKDFNENLNPLYSQLRKAVGRPWNKFYSELCKVFDKRSVINQHILQHLYDRIEVNLSERDGELWVRPRYGVPYLLRESHRFTEYYVDPRDGIIKRNKFLKTSRQRDRQLAIEKINAEFNVTRWLDADNVLRKIGDTWFHFTVEDSPPARYEYAKPPGVNEFNIGYGKKKIMRTWDQLGTGERRRFGARQLIGSRTRDLFTGEFTTVIDIHFRSQTQTRYHATKHTASRKTLKAAGIVK